MKIVKIHHFCDVCTDIEKQKVYSIRFADGTFRLCESCMGELMRLMNEQDLKGI